MLAYRLPARPGLQPASEQPPELSSEVLAARPCTAQMTRPGSCHGAGRPVTALLGHRVAPILGRRRFSGRPMRAGSGCSIFRSPEWAQKAASVSGTLPGGRAEALGNQQRGIGRDPRCAGALGAASSRILLRPGDLDRSVRLHRDVPGHGRLAGSGRVGDRGLMPSPGPGSRLGRLTASGSSRPGSRRPPLPVPGSQFRRKDDVPVGHVVRMQVPASLQPG